MAEQFTNDVTTTLNGAINNSTTSVVVTDGSKMPASGNFRIRIDDEIMTVTARSSNTLTVTRASENVNGAATAASHSDGATVSVVLTAAALAAGYVAVGGIGSVVVARKTADETVNNSSTLQNDDHLTFAIGASEVWAFDGALHLTTASSGTPDFKMDFAVPSGASGRYSCNGPQVGTTDSTNTQMNSAHQDIGATLSFGLTGGGQVGLIFSGVVVNSTTAGSVTLKWAQNTATAEDTKIRTNSYIKAVRIA